MCEWGERGGEGGREGGNGRILNVCDVDICMCVCVWCGG